MIKDRRLIFWQLVVLSNSFSPLSWSSSCWWTEGPNECPLEGLSSSRRLLWFATCSSLQLTPSLGMSLWRSKQYSGRQICSFCPKYRQLYKNVQAFFRSLGLSSIYSFLLRCPSLNSPLEEITQSFGCFLTIALDMFPGFNRASFILAIFLYEVILPVSKNGQTLVHHILFLASNKHTS